MSLELFCFDLLFWAPQMMAFSCRACLWLNNSCCWVCVMPLCLQSILCAPEVLAEQSSLSTNSAGFLLACLLNYIWNRSFAGRKQVTRRVSITHCPLTSMESPGLSVQVRSQFRIALPGHTCPSDPNCSYNG